MFASGGVSAATQGSLGSTTLRGSDMAICVRIAIAIGTAVGLSCALSPFVARPAWAASNKVRITKLTNVTFGSIANVGVDAVQAQSVCLYSDTNTKGYNIKATGSGPSGAFRLASGLNSLAYEVQWSSSAGQNSGIQLSPNIPLTGQVSAATQQACTMGPATSASLIVVLRSTALSSATAGSYSGTLTLVVGPE